MEKNDIRSKQELEFYIKADYLMNHGKWKPSLKTRIKEIISPDYISRYLVYMRKVNYYSNFRTLSVCGGG